MALSLTGNIDRNTMLSGLVVSTTNLTERIAPQLVAGDKVSLDVFLTSSSGVLDIQQYAVQRLGLGVLNSKPTGGTYKINYGSGSAETLAFDASAQSFADAIAAKAPSVPSPVTGTEIAPFTYIIQFGSNGTCSLPTIDSSTLSPSSTVSVQRLITGDSSTKERWIVRLYENPLALIDGSWTNIEPVTGKKGIRGSLNLGTQGIFDLLDGAQSTSVTMELELTDSDGNLQTIFQSPCVVFSQVIGESISGVIPAPVGIPAEATTFLNSFPNPEIAGDLDIQGGLQVYGDVTFEEGVDFEKSAQFKSGVTIDTGAADGYVLTSDATGTASWQANAGANNKGFFATPSDLTTAYSTGQNGWYAIVGTTDTFWVWDTDTTAWKDTDSNSLGTVTSVSVIGGTGIDSSGSPVTSSGSITVELDSATQTTLGKVATNETAITANTASIATKANQSQVTPLSATVTDHTGDILNNYNMIVDVQNDVDNLVYQSPLTFGIANTNAVKIDNTSAAASSGDICKFAANGIMPYTYANLKYDLGVDLKAPIASPSFTGSIDLSSYTSTSSATGASALNPVQNYQPATDDTVCNLCVDPSGNVVRGSQEATWTFNNTQLNALTSTRINLLNSAGADKCIVVEETNWLIEVDLTKAYQATNVKLACEMLGVNENSVATQMTAANLNQVAQILKTANTNSFGLYHRDVPDLARIYRFDVPMTIRATNGAGATNVFPDNFVSVKLKIKYRVFDKDTF